LTSTTFSAMPLASGAIVSDQVWQLASICPAESAEMESV